MVFGADVVRLNKRHCFLGYNASLSEGGFSSKMNLDPYTCCGVKLEYTKKQGTKDLHSTAIFKLGYTKKQGTKHLDSAIIFKISTCFWEIEIFVDNVEEN
ncbi:hypothetical protein Prudu_004581 [Prunus dulcis]|uniref:Uncharacterized protein n=1 Tax=Prunus dulcis TaxID=3755 RepID=A0A4Y1QVT0_PRUDU|nr:hypothetical protein Prudu_004581 [Prunus dulcis]